MQDDLEVDNERSTALFRIFQEALATVLQKANTTKVVVTLKERYGKVILKVRDNGKGIAEEIISQPGSIGLLGMRERVYPLRGSVIMNDDPNKGTVIEVTLAS